MSDDDFPTYDAGVVAYWVRQELNRAEDFYKEAHADGVAQLRAEIERLRAHNEIMKAALEPFAEHANAWPSRRDDLTVCCYVHVSPRDEIALGTNNFRDAAAAIAWKGNP